MTCYITATELEKMATLPTKDERDKEAKLDWRFNRIEGLVAARHDLSIENVLDQIKTLVSECQEIVSGK